MRRIYFIIVTILLISSCEKNPDEKNPTIKFYGDALEDIGYSISQTDNGYFIGGQFTEVSRIEENRIAADQSVKKLAVIKTDIHGNKIWKHSFGSKTAVGKKVITLEDGSVISTGYILDAASEKDIYVVKISADGLKPTEKIYNKSGNQTGIDIIKTSEGFMILGSTDVARGVPSDSSGNASGKTDVYQLRIDNNLELLDAQANGYWGNDQPVAIKNDKNGGYIIIGTTDNSWPGQGLNNIFILRTNIYGVSTGIRILGTTDDEYASDLEVLEDGYLIAGVVGTEGTDQWVNLIKIPEDIDSQIIFSNIFKVNSSSPATSFTVRAMSRYSTDSFVLAGQAGTGNSAKMLIFVADAKGNQVTGKEMITSATGIQVAYDVITDAEDNIIAVGKNSFENNSMITLFKIRFD